MNEIEWLGDRCLDLWTVQMHMRTVVSWQFYDNIADFNCRSTFETCLSHFSSTLWYFNVSLVLWPFDIFCLEYNQSLSFELWVPSLKNKTLLIYVFISCTHTNIFLLLNIVQYFIWAIYYRYKQTLYFVI
jgi:hypothetical protein